MKISKSGLIFVRVILLLMRFILIQEIYGIKGDTEMIFSFLAFV